MFIIEFLKNRILKGKKLIFDLKKLQFLAYVTPKVPMCFLKKKPANGPGVPRKKNLNSILFSLCHPQANHECPQTISALSVQPFGRPEGTFL